MSKLYATRCGSRLPHSSHDLDCTSGLAICDSTAGSELSPRGSFGLPSALSVFVKKAPNGAVTGQCVESVLPHCIA